MFYKYKRRTEVLVRTSNYITRIGQKLIKIKLIRTKLSLNRGTIPVRTIIRVAKSDLINLTIKMDNSILMNITLKNTLTIKKQSLNFMKFISCESCYNNYDKLSIGLNWMVSTSTSLAAGLQMNELQVNTLLKLINCKLVIISNYHLRQLVMRRCTKHSLMKTNSMMYRIFAMFSKVDMMLKMKRYPRYQCNVEYEVIGMQVRNACEMQILYTKKRGRWFEKFQYLLFNLRKSKFLPQTVLNKETVGVQKYILFMCFSIYMWQHLVVCNNMELDPCQWDRGEMCCGCW